jgi:hypothetical protein
LVHAYVVAVCYIFLKGCSLSFFQHLRGHAGASWWVTSLQDWKETGQGWLWTSICRSTCEWGHWADWSTGCRGESHSLCSAAAYVSMLIVYDKKSIGLAFNSSW